MRPGGTWMTPESLERVERLFHRARELTGAARQEFLARECGADTALRAELEALLQRGTLGELLLHAQTHAAAPPANGGSATRSVGHPPWPTPPAFATPSEIEP